MPEKGEKYKLIDLNLELSMKHYLYLAALLSVLFLAGCAASGPKYSAGPNATSTDGNLVIYRPNRHMSGGLYANVYLDNQHIGRLKNGGYIRINVGDGQHTLKVGGQTRTISSVNNEKLFFRFSYGWALFHAIEIVPQRLERIEEKAAYEELKETNESI